MFVSIHYLKGIKLEANTLLQIQQGATNTIWKLENYRDLTFAFTFYVLCKFVEPEIA